MTKSFKQLLATDELIQVFAVGRIAHPIVVEMFGLAGGFHGFWIDQEHCGIRAAEVVTLALAARANQMDSFVRMEPVGYWQVTQNLEAGAGGVMAAQIQSAEQAEQFVRWAKFAPRGQRGLNSGGRDGDYTHMPQPKFVEKANRESLVVIQIETRSAVDDAGKIAAIDGVDMLFIGPSDLSLSLGVVGQFHHDTLWQAIERVAEACRKHGKHWGALPTDAKFADRAVENGCRMLSASNDVLALRFGIDAMKKKYGRHFGLNPAQ